MSHSPFPGKMTHSTHCYRSCYRPPTVSRCRIRYLTAQLRTSNFIKEQTIHVTGLRNRLKGCKQPARAHTAVLREPSEVGVGIRDEVPLPEACQVGWLERGPLKSHPCPNPLKPVNVPLLGHRVFADGMP